MSVHQLTLQGYASRKELREAGMIKKEFNLGTNEWGFSQRVILDINDRQWDYIPEDQIYELSPVTEYRYLNN